MFQHTVTPSRINRNNQAHRWSPRPLEARTPAVWKRSQPAAEPAVTPTRQRRRFVADMLRQSGFLNFQVEAGSPAGADRRNRFYSHLLDSRTIVAARRSVSSIESLFRYFEAIGDRPGQQQTLILALAGRNHARRQGRIDEAMVFDRWLDAH